MLLIDRSVFKGVFLVHASFAYNFGNVCVCAGLYVCLWRPVFTSDTYYTVCLCSHI